MDVRHYPLRPIAQAALTHDGSGKIGVLYTKSFTLAAMADAATQVIPLIDKVNGSSIQSFVVQLRLANGALNAAAHRFEYAPATGNLTITAAGAVIAANTVLTIFYIVAVK